MTVKLAKLFSSSAASNVTVATPAHTTNAHHLQPYYSASTNGHYTAAPLFNTYVQQQQQPQNVVVEEEDEEEDDNISLYSTATSSAIMTSRDRPFNNSQRPLLAERKPKAPPQLLLLNKKKHFNVVAQQSQLQPQPQAPSLVVQKTYLSPYMSQQKRDSAKGLHGFNDFDILSQQYTHHLQSPHIGYPYGSPPSPTATSSDFVFDSPTTQAAEAAAPRYANVGQQSGSDANQMQQQRLGNASTINKNKAKDAVDKASRFEDDFCCRRNASFLHSTRKLPPLPPLPAQRSQDLAHSDTSSAGQHGGPFIFGLSHEQQSDLQRMPPGGRGFNDSLSDDMDAVINGVAASTVHKHSSSSESCGLATMQSTSDTSTSSRDCSGGGKKGARKFLLRKRKSKKNSKDKSTKTETQQTVEEGSDNSRSEPTIKCVVVGDGAVGKTNLIRTYLENRFNTEHVPTASDIYNADVMVNDSPVHLTLCDTAGQDTLDPLRELCYPDSDVFLLCFSVARPDTFHSIKSKWAPKFSKTKAALILVGTQADLRTEPNVLDKFQTNAEKPISYADAWDLATTIGAKYIETSSATQDKVKEVFDTAIWEGLVPTSLPPTPPPLWKRLLCLA